MLNKRFCFIAGTGRNASHFMRMIFNKYVDNQKVASFHDGLFSRLKMGKRHTAQRCLENYLINLMVRAPHVQTYIECNPAALEYVGLCYGVKSADLLIGAHVFEPLPKSLLIVRHPFGYVRSMKAIGYQWNWHTLPAASEVYPILAKGWDKMSPVERYAHAWKVKNTFFLSLMEEPLYVPCLKMEDIFRYKTHFVTFVKEICEHFGVQLLATDTQLKQIKDQKVQQKNKGGRVTLTQAEKDTITAICKPVMDRLGYE